MSSYYSYEVHSRQTSWRFHSRVMLNCPAHMLLYTPFVVVKIVILNVNAYNHPHRCACHENTYTNKRVACQRGYTHYMLFPIKKMRACFFKNEVLVLFLIYGRYMAHSFPKRGKRACLYATQLTP